MKRYLLLALLFLTGCAAWQAGIHDPQIVSHAIAEAQPYKEVADSIYPNAGKVVAALIIPLLILLGGRKKIKNENT